MPRREMDIDAVHRQKGTVWIVRYRDIYGIRHHETFRTRADARRRLVAVKADLQRGTYVDPRPRKASFEELAWRWLETKRHRRATTATRYEEILKGHLLPTFGVLDVRRLADQPELVQGWVSRQEAAGLSPATIRKHVGLLKQIFDLAARGPNPYVHSNPCRHLELPPIDEEEAPFLDDPAHIRRLAEAHPPRFYALIMLSGFVGVRWGEAAGLRLERVNLLKRQLHIYETLIETNGRFDPHRLLGPPKTKRGKRVVPLPESLVPILEQHIAEYVTGDFLFTTQKGEPLHRAYFRLRVFKPAAARAGLSPDITFHSLRHTAMSILASRGASVHEVAEILGWSRSTEAQMAARYSHMFKSREDYLTGQMDGVIRQVLAAPRAEPLHVLPTRR